MNQLNSLIESRNEKIAAYKTMQEYNEKVYAKHFDVVRLDRTTSKEECDEYHQMEKKAQENRHRMIYLDTEINNLALAIRKLGGRI